MEANFMSHFKSIPDPRIDRCQRAVGHLVFVDLRCVEGWADVTYREDEWRIRRGNGAEVLSVLRRLTLNLLKQNTTSRASLKHTRKIAAMDDQLCAEISAGI
jgi:hypothetical protein